MIPPRRIKGFKGTVSYRARKVFFKWFQPNLLPELIENNSILKTLKKLCPQPMDSGSGRSMSFRRFKPLGE